MHVLVLEQVVESSGMSRGSKGGYISSAYDS